ncbi:hypothetical protein [Escherichia coli]
MNTPAVLLPTSLTSDTPVPFIPNPLTYGESLDECKTVVRVREL